MPRQLTTRQQFSYGWLRGEDWWGDPVSENFVRLDMLVAAYVKSMTTISPPSGLTLGDMYIIPPGALGAWAGKENQLAVVTEDAEFVYCVPTRGVRARLADPESWIWFTGTAWVGEGQNSDVSPVPLGTRYDIAVFVGYEAEPNEVILAFVIPESMTLPNGAGGSFARCTTPPLGIFRLAVKRNGIDIATITFNPSSVYGVINVAGNKLFTTGDLLSVHVPEDAPVGFETYSTTLRLILANNGG